VIFAARGIAVCLSVFALLYGTLSLLMCSLWRRIERKAERLPARMSANLLFAARMFPLISAITLTLALAMPSFLLLEPRSIDEPVGLIPVLLGFCGLSVIALGAWNGVAAMASASRAITRWTSESAGNEALTSDGAGSIPVWRVASSLPTLAAAGILRPRVLLSRRAEFVLAPRELQTALRHELAHVRRWDNLRKLLIRLAAFPGMAELEVAWREATEMAADDAAVRSASEALDLAAALIKLSRFGPLEPPAELTTALVHNSAESVNARVERLIAWSEPRPEPRHSVSWYGLAGTLGVLACLFLTYSRLLLEIHNATEWLVR
jgi:Zn-dependent protease with chaperone function